MAGKKMEYLPLVKSVFNAIKHDCMPDLTILLDVSPEVGLQRVHMREQAANRFDEEEMAFHQRIREGYKQHLSDYGKSAVIDANQPLEEVWTTLLNAVQSAL